MKSILVPIEDHDHMGAVLTAAVRAGRLFESYIEGVPLGPDLAELVAADVSMSGIVFDDRMRRDVLQHAAETFHAAMREAQLVRRTDEVQGLSYGWLGASLMSPAGLGEYGRLFDLIVVGRPGPTSSDPHRSTLETALFESGRPLLIVPPSPPPVFASIIAIAWNGSSETARSIAFALPLLTRARDVPILTVPGLQLPGPSDSELARSLRRHGIPARVVEVKEGARTPAHALLEAAAELGCDLMIKGGYTQSRLRQMIFGSVTSDILAEASLPVFMAH